MANKIYKEIYIVSFVGEYELKHARPIIDFFSLSEYSKELHALVVKHVQTHSSIDEDYISYLHYMSGTDEELKKKAFDNAEYLIEVLNNGVGADDGHYDYFPDLVEQFKQLCQQLNLRDLHNETVKKLKEHDEYKDCDEVDFELI